MHLLFQTTRPLGPETGAGDDDDMGLVGQAIQTCRGQQGGSEQVGPLLQGTVTGEHNATPLVPLVDDVVEVLGGRRVQRLEPVVGKPHAGICARVVGQLAVLRAP